MPPCRINECKAQAETYDSETRSVTITQTLTFNVKVPLGPLPSERESALQMTDRELSTFFERLWGGVACAPRAITG